MSQCNRAIAHARVPVSAAGDKFQFQVALLAVSRDPVLPPSDGHHSSASSSSTPSAVDEDLKIVVVTQNRHLFR